MKKIKWIKPGAKFNMAYFPGDVCEVDAKKADLIIEAKFAIEIEGEVAAEPKPKKATKKA